MAETEEEVAFDERFEFDAPQFYDFDEGSPPEKPLADGWFDTEGPRGLATPPKPQQEQQERKPAAGAAAGAPENVNPHQTDAAGQQGSGKGKEWRRALASITNNTTGKAARQPQKQQGIKRKAAAGSTGEPAGSSAAAAAAVAGSSKVRPGSATAKQQQSHERPGSRQAKSLAGAVMPSSQATSPRLRSRQRAHTGEHKTSEQLELERVEQEKVAAAALRRHNAETFKHVLGAPPPPVVHSSRPLTEPVAVELSTSRRRRMHSMETRSMASPFKSMAEQIAAFEGRLPGKSKLGNSSGGAAAQPQQAQHLQSGHHGAPLTVPQSPQFATKKRARPPRFKPREVVEAEEMAAMPKFRARPVNKRILRDHSGQLGVPQVDAKPPTVPAPFALKTDQRAAEHTGSAGAGSAGTDHHAGSGAGAAPAGAFVFAAAGREGGRVTRSKAAANKAAAQQSRWTGQVTHPEPFLLATDARGAAKRPAADPMHEEQARPSKRVRRSVAPGPFQLATDARGAAEEARLEGIRRQQEEQARRDAEFKALPLNTAALAGTWKPPSVAPAPLTVPHKPGLHSDARAEQRRAFDDAVAAKQAEQQAERQRLLALQAAAEEEEVRQLRRGMVPKALPLPGRL